MASYTSHCDKGDTYIDFYRPIAERDDTPVCCGSKTARLLAAPMVPVIGLADHYAITGADGRIYYGKHQYEKYLNANGLLPASELQGEAEYQKAEVEKKRRASVREDVIKAAQSVN